VGALANPGRIEGSFAQAHIREDPAIAVNIPPAVR
jgi:hypothetical protein